MHAQIRYFLFIVHVFKIPPTHHDHIMSAHSATHLQDQSLCDNDVPKYEVCVSEFYRYSQKLKLFNKLAIALQVALKPVEALPIIVKTSGDGVKQALSEVS
jgi:hypothetical protein